MTVVGLGITFATVLVLVVEFLRHKQRSLAAYGWAGFVFLLVAEGLMFRGFPPVAIYFTPIAWTCYILMADAAVLAISGHSRIHDDPRGFLWLAVLSIPLWTVFELYNLRLENWTYVGVPVQLALGLLGYGWSFATIFPGIFETADLIESFGWFKPARPIRFSGATQVGFVVFGAACLLIPVLIPQRIASYLFAPVWVGFVFLLDPINSRVGLPSFIGDFDQGRRSRFYSFLISGFVCGWLWEFWNYWAAAKWHYIFPILQGWKVFEMPIPGFLGFLPFALECFTMYITAAWALRILKARQPDRMQDRLQPVTRFSEGE